MKREIKFRAWDIESQKMIDDYGNTYYVETFGWNSKHIEIMQFTGLKDKNGKEIYEGDILYGYPHGISIVKWDSDYGCWHSGLDLIGNELKEMPERTVIGNIYENPELLNQKD